MELARTPLSLTVSIDKSILTVAPASSVDHLKERLRFIAQLPQGTHKYYVNSTCKYTCDSTLYTFCAPLLSNVILPFSLHELSMNLLL